MNTLIWKTAAFGELSATQFHNLIALRIEVFVVEQDCPYQEADGLDKLAIHLWAEEDGETVACLRLVPPGLAYECPAIGRVVTKSTHRSIGLGHQLMQRGMALAKEQYGSVPIKLSAQEHLKAYYGKHGFVQFGSGYLEDGIPHIPMIFDPSAGG